MGNTKNAYGKPVFDDAYSFPQDSQDAVDFANDFANVRVGTSSDRTALVSGKRRPAMLFVETDTKTIYGVDGSLNWYVALAPDSGWTNITLSTGWTAVSGHTPRVRMINGVVYMEGAATRGSGAALNNIGVIPVDFRHLQTGAKTIFIGAHVANKSGTVAMAEVYISETGVISCSGYTGIDGTTGWILPMSGHYVRDQR